MAFREPPEPLPPEGERPCNPNAEADLALLREHVGYVEGVGLVLKGTNGEPVPLTAEDFLVMSKPLSPFDRDRRSTDALLEAAKALEAKWPAGLMAEPPDCPDEP